MSRPLATASAREAARDTDSRWLPSLDQMAYYDKPPVYLDSSEDEGFAPAGPSKTNLHNKLNRNAQFMRHGKLAAWTPFYEDVQTDRHARKRLAACLDQFMPDAAAEVGAEVPANIAASNERRRKRRKQKEEDRKYILPHLRSPSPPMSSEQLAPMLALPESYLDIMMSPAMRHALGNDTVEQGLQRTASDLLESEKPIMQALGRMRDILRLRQRDVQPLLKPRWEEGRGRGADRVNCYPFVPNAKHIYDLPIKHETDNLWHIAQELNGNRGFGPVTISYTATDPRVVAEESLPPLREPTTTGNGTGGNPNTDPAETNQIAINVTPVQALFVVPEGITLSATQKETGRTVRQYNIKLAQQVNSVDDAMERMAEVLADLSEYKERLEEARERVADVARARKKIWEVIKTRAGKELDELEDKEREEKEARARVARERRL